MQWPRSATWFSPLCCEYHSRTEEGIMRFHWFAAVLCLYTLDAMAQAPATPTPPPPVPADVSPLYVITYVELRPNAKSEGAAILKSWRDAQRKAEGNLRA